MRLDNVGVDSCVYQEYHICNTSEEPEGQIDQMVCELCELSLEDIETMMERNEISQRP